MENNVISDPLPMKFHSFFVYFLNPLSILSQGFFAVTYFMTEILGKTLPFQQNAVAHSSEMAVFSINLFPKNHLAAYLSDENLSVLWLLFSVFSLLVWLLTEVFLVQRRRAGVYFLPIALVCSVVITMGSTDWSFFPNILINFLINFVICVLIYDYYRKRLPLLRR